MPRRELPKAWRHAHDAKASQAVTPRYIMQRPTDFKTSPDAILTPKATPLSG